MRGDGGGGGGEGGGGTGVGEGGGGGGEGCWNEGGGERGVVGIGADGDGSSVQDGPKQSDLPSRISMLLPEERTTVLVYASA